MQIAVSGAVDLAEKIKQAVIQMIELHRHPGQTIRRVALSHDHFVIEKGGLPVAVIMSMPEYEKLTIEVRLKEHERLARAIGAEAERQGYTEEQMLAELEEDKQAVYQEMYGKPPQK